ncbi:protein-glutamine glutaminase family protein, partial [Lentzea sp.]|uniref:protein-glutamine glutaminase family protein n=1 Tax=Lentzea sp. TaxID=56099 RepID=UPI002ED2DA0A
MRPGTEPAAPHHTPTSPVTTTNVGQPASASTTTPAGTPAATGNADQQAATSPRQPSLASRPWHSAESTIRTEQIPAQSLAPLTAIQLTHDLDLPGVDTSDSALAGTDPAAPRSDDSPQHQTAEQPGNPATPAPSATASTPDDTVTPPLPDGAQLPQAPTPATSAPTAPHPATSSASPAHWFALRRTLTQPAVGGLSLLTQLHRLARTSDVRLWSAQIEFALTTANNEGRLPDSTYQRALEVLKRSTGLEADSDSESPIDSIAVGRGEDPAELPKVRNLARRLGRLVRAGDFDGAITLLDKLDRNPPVVRAVEKAYRARHNRDLGTDLRALKPEEKDFVDFALGATTEEPVSVGLATSWLNEMRDLTFEHPDSGHHPVPHDYPESGCYFRAHSIALALQQRGIRPVKVFAAGPDLQITSSDGEGGTTGRPVEVQLDYHVAAAIPVIGPRGPVLSVLDPTVDAQRPLPLAQWLTALNVDSASARHHRGSTAVIRERLMEQQDKTPDAWEEGYPVNQQIVVVTDAQTFDYTELVEHADTSWERSDREFRDSAGPIRSIYAETTRRRVDRALADLVERTEARLVSGVDIDIDDVTSSIADTAAREPIGVRNIVTREPEPLRRLYELLPDHRSQIQDALETAPSDDESDADSSSEESTSNPGSDMDIDSDDDDAPAGPAQDQARQQPDDPSRDEAGPSADSDRGRPVPDPDRLVYPVPHGYSRVNLAKAVAVQRGVLRTIPLRPETIRSAFEVRW